MSEHAPDRTDPDASMESGAAAATTQIAWHSVMVEGHRVRYGVAGAGPTALFLHGWGLRPNAYRRAIEAMGAAGCRVFAPSLPGFGGTRELPP